ncbi:putative hydro-lyase [Burkholderia gladioli]|uniref:putative hydro-lyase n=1 Tax=Burkholderia gladioli TaxID=28095 RepID=UPI00163FFECB|nr:putative hydro-lyase [Burkholderia gladioli]
MNTIDSGALRASPDAPALDTPRAARLAFRAGYDGNTSGAAPGHAQGNLVILPAAWADDFAAYCRANPTPCPLIGMTEPGSPLLPALGEDLDLRRDLPRYRVWRDGVLVDEPREIAALWRDDFVGFVIGCSLSFEHALEQAGLRVRHVDERKVVPMYRSAIPTVPVGPFRGPTVVSMRPYTAEQTAIAFEVCARLPGAHGAPLHVGDPAAIGIADVNRPDEGEPTEIRAGEQPVFWGCGVTPQAAVIEARPPICITHAPGYMLVCDPLVEDLRLV